jgi:hypothetical protein
MKSYGLTPAMVDWVAMTNSLTVTNGLLLLHDTDSPRPPQRFYRVVEK